MNLKQACEYLSISEATGRNWIKQGRLQPVFRDGDKRGCFHSDSLKKIKRELEKDGKLTKRRNKTAIRSSIAYFNYLECPPETKEQLARIIAYYEENNVSLLRMIAHYAEVFFANIHEAKKFRPLIDDLLALETRKAKDDAISYPPLSFQPYEDLLGYLYISLTKLDLRKKAGIYYTPSVLAKKLIRRSLAFSQNTDSVFDPACGTGNFLLNILAWQNTEGSASPVSKNGSRIAHFYGQDTDPAAVAIARINMALNMPALGLDTLYQNIRVSDSLRVFPEYKNTLILGNPPWGARVKYSGSFLQAAPSTGRHHKANSTDSSALFLQAAVLRQNEKGIISFLLPASLLTSKQYSEIRKTIWDHTQILSIDYLEQTFSKVDCPSVILTLQKDTRRPGIKRCEVYKKEKHYTIRNRKDFFGTDCRFILHADDKAYDLFCRMNRLSNAVTLKGNADFALGIVTGDNSRFLIPADTADNFSDNKSGGPFPEPVIRGFNLDQYRIHGPYDRIRYTPNAFQQCAPERFYRAKEKLLYRFIGKKPVFAYDNKGRLTLNSCNILIPRISGMDLKYILAVLNSSAAAFYWQTGFDSVKLLRSHIEALPIPMPSHTDQKAIVTLVDKLLTESENYDIIAAKEIQNAIDEKITRLYQLSEKERFLLL